MEAIKHRIENTTLTLQAIADDLGVGFKVVWNVWRKYPAAYRKQRKVKNYSRSKAGDRNPMFGKLSEAHHNYLGVVSDNKGYLMVLKPQWFTGRKRSKHVFQHHVVYCMAVGATEIPAGCCVHHCDHNKHNNEFDNLLLMTLAEHTALHQQLGRAETISKESTAKWLEARRAGNGYDIVRHLEESGRKRNDLA